MRRATTGGIIHEAGVPGGRLASWRSEVLLRPMNYPADGARVAQVARSVGSKSIVGNLDFDLEQKLPAGYVARRIVAQDDMGELHGYSLVGREPWQEAGRFEVWVVVDPSRRKTGTGGALLDDALRFAREAGATSLVSMVADTDPESVRFAERRGFAVSQQFFTMVLDMASYHETRFSDAVETAKAAGLRFFTFADVPDTTASRHKLFELNRRLAPDLPGNDDTFPLYEQYVQEIIEADWFRADGQFIAADGDNWVGLVGMSFDEQTATVRIEFTAIDRQYRGRGLGLALKVHSISFARKLAARSIRTGNDSGNAAILAINRRLGFRQEPGLYRLERHLARDRHDTA